jgi:hypothetical protein
VKGTAVAYDTIPGGVFDSRIRGNQDKRGAGKRPIHLGSDFAADVPSGTHPVDDGEDLGASGLQKSLNCANQAGQPDRIRSSNNHHHAEVVETRGIVPVDHSKVSDQELIFEGAQIVDQAPELVP